MAENTPQWTWMGNRWALGLRAAVTLAFGICAFLWPALTLALLVLIYGAYMLGDGVFAFIAGIMTRTWAMLLVGALGIAAGIVTIFWPAVTTVILLYIIAITAIVRGIFEIVSAVSWRHVLTYEWLLILSGMVSILFGAIILAYPLAGAVAAIYFIATYAVILSVILFLLAAQAGAGPSPAQPVSHTPPPQAP